MDRPASHLVVPCGHQCLCEGCVPLLRDNKCPVCRCDVMQTIRVFACGWQVPEPAAPISKDQKRKQRSHSESKKKASKKLKDKKKAKTETATTVALADVGAVPSAPGVATQDAAGVADPTAIVILEVTALKAVLDAPDSSNNQVEEALQKLAAGLCMPLTEELLRRTSVGFSVNVLSKSERRGDGVQNKAAQLVETWKVSILAARQMQRSASTELGRTLRPTSDSAEVSTVPDSNRGVRGELEVMTVNMAKAAQRRIVRHANAARQNITRALPVEDCINLDDEDSDNTGGTREAGCNA